MTDAELADLRRRAAACVTHHGCDCREYRLRALEAAARAVLPLVLERNVVEYRDLCDCCGYLFGEPHDADCPVGVLAALVEEGQDG